LSCPCGKITRIERIVDGGSRPTALTLLAVALRREETFLGSIVIYRREVRPFADKQIALLQNFAAQAVIAMESARLITETREALEQQTAPAEVLHVINSSPGDLAPVFDAMLDKAMRLCGAAYGFMTVIDGERSRTVAACGVRAAYAAFRERNPSPANAPISSRLRKGEPFIHTVDLKAERFYEEGDPQRRAIVDLGGARTLLAVSLMRDQAVLGAIQVYRTEVRPFADKQARPNWAYRSSRRVSRAVAGPPPIGVVRRPFKEPPLTAESGGATRAALLAMTAHRGTRSSNPLPSSGESVSHTDQAAAVENRGFSRGCAAPRALGSVSDETSKPLPIWRGTERCYGAGGEDGNFVAASTDGVPRCPSRTT
jgi:hypothetical protein